MRKKEKEIKDIKQIESIISKALVCRLGLCVNNQPYIVPMNFGYKEMCLYFHTGLKGEKIDILELNNSVSFEIDCDHKMISGELACNWSMDYKSVIGFGKAEFVTDPGDKIKALDIIMSQYTDPPFEYKAGPLEKTCIIKVKISKLSGRVSIH